MILYYKDLNFLIFGVILFVRDVVLADPVERLNPVLGFPDIDEFYLKVREYDKKKEARPLEKDLPRDVKTRIYIRIFNSHTFERMGLSTLQSNIFFKMLRPQDYEIMTEYPHISLPVRTHSQSEPVTEHVFPVYVRDDRNNDITAFLMSEEYDVNVDFEPFSAGRFLFRIHEDKTLTVLDLIEEPAKVIEDSPEELERLYLEARKDKQIADEARENHLQLLNEDQRVQVCSSVLNSQFFDKKIEYFLVEKTRLFDDGPWTVEFDHQQVEENATAYEELPIVCPAKLKRRTEEGYREGDIIYLVTRGNEPDKVFVYTRKFETERKITLLNLSAHVRNVYEWKLPLQSKPNESTDTTGVNE